MSITLPPAGTSTDLRAATPSPGATGGAPAAPDERGPAGARERLLALDVFRGLTVAGMLLVNNPGSWGAIYPPLEHAEWHGWTPTDLIFPFFLFIAGVSPHVERRAMMNRRFADRSSGAGS